MFQATEGAPFGKKGWVITSSCSCRDEENAELLATLREKANYCCPSCKDSGLVVIQAGLEEAQAIATAKHLNARYWPVGTGARS